MDMHKMTPWHWLHQIGCGFVVYLSNPNRSEQLHHYFFGTNSASSG
ncbi:MAG: hypothetical protein ACJA0B_001077 [Alcanivorax borkumensis]|jgi:hypothetical protein